MEIPPTSGGNFNHVSKMCCVTRSYKVLCLAGRDLACLGIFRVPKILVKTILRGIRTECSEPWDD